MDARLQRRLRRAEIREKNLKKEAEKNKKVEKWAWRRKTNEKMKHTQHMLFAINTKLFLSATVTALRNKMKAFMVKDSEMGASCGRDLEQFW